MVVHVTERSEVQINKSVILYFLKNICITLIFPKIMFVVCLQLYPKSSFNEYIIKCFSSASLENKHLFKCDKVRRVSITVHCYIRLEIWNIIDLAYKFSCTNITHFKRSKSGSRFSFCVETKYFPFLKGLAYSARETMPAIMG